MIKVRVKCQKLLNLIAGKAGTFTSRFGGPCCGFGSTSGFDRFGPFRAAAFGSATASKDTSSRDKTDDLTFTASESLTRGGEVVEVDEGLVSNDIGDVVGEHHGVEAVLSSFTGSYGRTTTYLKLIDISAP